MFIRSRQVKGRSGQTYVYHSIVQTYRAEDKKPRQKTLFDMGKHRTIDECIARAQKQLDYWLAQDQRQLETWAGALGMEVVPDLVITERARWQREIDWLRDAATKV